MRFHVIDSLIFRGIKKGGGGGEQEGRGVKETPEQIAKREYERQDMQDELDNPDYKEVKDKVRGKTGPTNTPK